MPVNKLYVLGNGFDIHHDVKSSYINYRDWLKKEDPSILDDINEVYGMPDEPWWKSFEEHLTSFKHDFFKNLWALSEAELVKRLNVLNPDLLSRIDHYLSKEVLVRSYASARAVQLVRNIKDSFSDWVIDIDVNKPKSTVLSIDPNENLLALDFNYTRSLESIYGVDYADVNHIHGKVDDENDDSDWYDPKEFILGHGLSADDMVERDWVLFKYDNTNNASCFSYDEEKGEDNIAHLEAYSVIEDMKKPVDDIIENNMPFWDQLSHIREVVIAGMSFSSIDEKYFDTIFERVPKDALITVYFYSDQDLKNTETYMKKSGRLFKGIKW